MPHSPRVVVARHDQSFSALQVAMMLAALATKVAALGPLLAPTAMALVYLLYHAAHL